MQDVGLVAGTMTVYFNDGRSPLVLEGVRQQDHNVLRTLIGRGKEVFQRETTGGIQYTIVPIEVSGLTFSPKGGDSGSG